MNNERTMNANRMNRMRYVENIFFFLNKYDFVFAVHSFFAQCIFQLRMIKVSDVNSHSLQGV